MIPARPFPATRGEPETSPQRRPEGPAPVAVTAR
jgi:hypothetical protein